jgi:hypothetical protein
MFHRWYQASKVSADAPGTSANPKLLRSKNVVANAQEALLA